MEYKNHIAHYQMDGDFYDYFAPDKYIAVEIHRRYQAFLHLGRSLLHPVVLDLGSGNGEMASLLPYPDARYIPFDISEKNLKRIRKFSDSRTIPVNGDTYHLPFVKDSIDLIIMSEIIEHLAHPPEALKEAARILKKSGRLILSVPYKEKISYHLCIHCNKPTPANAHLYAFTPESFRDMLIQAGFKPVKILKILNKVMNRLYLNYYLRFLPYRIWKILDACFNSVIDKPASMIFVCEKE